MRLFGELTKVEPQEDGTIKVYGIASSGARDAAGEIILPEAMRSAIPDYMAFGALREMHQPHSAAGTALECSVDAAGVTQFAAHVVDPLAVKKVQTGVYKGFSVGGKVLERDPNDRSTITKIRLSEVSLVDRPCNNDATLNLWKADIADPEGADMSKPYVPTNDEVKAEAAVLAKAAGKADRPQDFLAKAREGLTERGLPVADAPAVEPAVPPASPSIDETILAADASAKPAETPPVAKADPAAALSAALAKATGGGKPDAVTPGLSDLGRGLAKLGELYGEDPMAKGFWSIGMLAEAVETLVSLQSHARYEDASSGGDGGQAAQMLAEASQAAGQALMQYVKEMVANALVTMQSGGAKLEVVLVDGDEAIALAAATVDLVKADVALMEKAGKRNSSKDQKHVQDAHDSACKAGAKCDPGNMPEDSKKVAGGDDLAKAQAENDRLTKAIEAALPQIDELAARLLKVEAQPMPPKAAGSSHAAPSQVVEKIADATGGAVQPAGASLSDEDVQKALDAMLPEARADILMRAALSRPIQISR
jgi:phage head maturation protease